jgi:hypothetical protein
LQKSFSSNFWAGGTPTPQEKMTIVGWASCQSYLLLFKRSIDFDLTQQATKSKLKVKQVG